MISHLSRFSAVVLTLEKDSGCQFLILLCYLIERFVRTFMFFIYAAPGLRYDLSQNTTGNKKI